ncbi:MAG: hypothetical protein LBG67_00335 [Campylobacteraceae bacterium]|jgi:hypothetical protein|nr:hypothetical protein [Campylobacteraceae bacterium]
MIRQVFQPLVNRFCIPRPTLVEWQKCIKNEKLKNWRATHLEYLREQVEVENQTKLELSQKGVLVDDLFSICVYLFLNNKRSVPTKDNFMREFRHFMLHPENSIEYQHDFAKRIWKEEVVDERKIRVGEYFNILKLIDTLTSFQYYVLLRVALKFVFEIYENENMMCKKGLIGKTWQELHMYDKAFSHKKLESYFKYEKIL